MADPVIPQFLQNQFAQAQQGPQMSNGSQYGRWNGVNNNAFGLAPSGWPSLYGYHAPSQGAWQPPWGHNGAVGQPLPGGQMPQLPNGQLPQLPSGGQLPQMPQGGQLPQLSGSGYGSANQTSGQLNGVPGMDPANFGQAPQAPQGGPTQQFNLNNSVASQMQSPTGRAFLANLSKYGQAGMNRYLSEPQSASVADFNRLAQTNPVMAEQLSAAGGQGFRNAISSNNQWSPQQMNSFINQYGSGALPGFGG